MKLYERRKLDYSVPGLLGVAARSLARGGVAGGGMRRRDALVSEGLGSCS